MTGTPISQSDINSLANKLDGLNLSTEQHALLSAIVTVAAKAAHGDVDTTQPAPSFHDQFASAFTPGLAEEVFRLAHHITR